MRNIKLYTKENESKKLIDKIKNNHREIYEFIYKNNKNLIVECVIENEQKPLLDVVNIMMLKNSVDERFFESNKEEIERIVKHDLGLDNMIFEFELYEKKKAMASDSMSYEEVMALEVDEDKTIYDKDFDVMLRLIKSVKNLYLWGNAGNGKTTFAYNVAKELDLQLFNINSVKNEFSVKGFFDLEGKYTKSLYEKWYSEGGVLLLDECDSYSSNGMLYLNNGIEVNSKYLTLEDGSTIHKNPNCYVIACANTDGLGKTSDYIGRNAIDKAFMSRFTKKEYKEYAYIHKLILDDKNYQPFKTYFNKKNVELTCRLCVKLKSMLSMFSKEEIIVMLESKEIEL